MMQALRSATGHASALQRCRAQASPLRCRQLQQQQQHAQQQQHRPVSVWCRRQRRLTTTRAQQPGGSNSSNGSGGSTLTPQRVAAVLVSTPLARPFVGLVGTRAYLAMEAVALLVVLGLTDAGYSGDWSRIGAISTDTELLLQKLTLFVWGAHALTGVAAAGLAGATAGRSRAGAVLKGTLFGALTLYEEAVLLQRQTERAEAG